LNLRLNMLQGLCLFWTRNFKLLKKIGILAVYALYFVLVAEHKQTAAMGTWRWDGFFPRSEIAGGVIGASVKHPAFAGLADDQVTAIFGALNADLLQQGFGISACGKIAASNKFAIAPPSDDQFSAR